MYLCMSVCVFMHVYVCARVSMCEYVHMYIHTYMRACVYRFVCMCMLLFV